MSVRFYCRESKKHTDGKSPIEMVINLEGVRIVTHLPRREAPLVFDRLMNSRKTNSLLEYLNALESRLRDFESESIRDGEPLSVESIRAFIEAGYVRKSITVHRGYSTDHSGEESTDLMHEMRNSCGYK